jgi:hypothetical protein
MLRRSLFAVLAVALGQSINVFASAPVAVDGNGNPIGYYLGPSRADSSNDVRLVSSKGYTFVVDQLTGTLSSIGYHTGTSTQGTWGGMLFESGDCTGQGYFHFTPSYDRQTRIIGGFVFRWRDQFFYVPKTTISEPRTFLSERSELDGSCLSVNVEDARTLPVFDNDELTTGVKASYPAPITIAVRSTLATQFEDGFESV